MNKAVFSYAIVNHLWHKKNLSISDLLIPMYLNVLKVKHDLRIHKSKLHKLNNTFKKVYGFASPTLDLTNKLNNAKEYLCDTSDGFYTLNLAKFDEDFKDYFDSSKDNDIDLLLKDFKIYLIENYDIDTPLNDLEALLEDFLAEHGLNVINDFLNNTHTNIEVSKANYRHVADFIANCTNEQMNILCNVFIGNVIINVLKIPNKDKQVQDIHNSHVFNGCNVYLDTPILIPLLKASPEEQTMMYEEFLSILKKSGAKIKTFSHICDEIENILHSAYDWLKSGNFLREKASRAAKYFFDNCNDLTHLEYLINDVRNVIVNNLGIEIDSFSYEEHEYSYLIDEDKLTEIILNLYKENNQDEYFDELRYNTPIHTDVASISAIQAMRKAVVPNSLSEYTNVLVTRNWGLVKATKIYTSKEYDTLINLNWTVLVDSYLCGLLWDLQPKEIIESYCKNKLISDCLAFISPSKEFLHHYAQSVKEFSKNKGVNCESFNLLFQKANMSTAAYIRCGDKYECIPHTLEEIDKWYKAKIEKPHIDRITKQQELIDDLKNKNQSLENDKHLMSKETELHIRHKEALEKERNAAKSELALYKKQIELQKIKEEFYRKNKVKVIFYYLKHPLPLLDLALIILSVLLGLLVNSVWFILLLICFIAPIVYLKSSLNTMLPYNEFKEQYIRKNIDDYRTST